MNVGAIEVSVLTKEMTQQVRCCHERNTCHRLSHLKSKEVIYICALIFQHGNNRFQLPTGGFCQLDSSPARVYTLSSECYPCWRDAQRIFCPELLGFFFFFFYLKSLSELLLGHTVVHEVNHCSGIEYIWCAKT